MPRPKSDDKLVPVMVRLAASEVETLDARRGDRSRSDYVRSLLFAVVKPSGPRPKQTPHAEDCSCYGCRPPKEAKG